MAKVKNKKTGAKRLSCQDCIHEWACSMSCGGYPMHSDNANRCAVYEDVKGSAAYFIGFLDGKDASSNGTVDAVEVVRCKDCIHWDSATGWCNNHSAFDDHDMGLNIYNDDDFCSLGERRTDG